MERKNCRADPDSVWMIVPEEERGEGPAQVLNSTFEEGEHPWPFGEAPCPSPKRALGPRESS